MTKRPERLKDLHGQNHIKRQLEIAIKSAKQRNEPVGHILLTGNPGLGKTTIAGTIAAERGVGFFPVIGTSIKSETDMKEILASKLNSDGYSTKCKDPISPQDTKPTVLFIDEIHNLPRKVSETLYTVMEDRTYWDEVKNSFSGRATKVAMWVPKFTLIGATTREGDLEKPFLDRFPYKLKLIRYTDTECIKFVMDEVTEAGLKLKTPAVAAAIARRARGVARVAINLARQCIDACIAEDTDVLTEEIVTNYFNLSRIDEFGLTDLDRKILVYLNSTNRPIGINAIASYLGESKASVENHYEPFLVEKDLVGRLNRGRAITEKGVRYLEYKGLGETLDKRRELSDRKVEEFTI